MATRTPSLAFALTSAAALVGCAPNFDPQSEITKLRVLAVQKDKPYARPGETVNLRMLIADGSERSDAGRAVQVLWLAGCENPAADLYAGCFSDIAEGTEAPEIQVGEGFEFSFTLSDDIISRRPPPADVKQPPYGLAYVFFAACAGEVEFLSPSDAKGFPIACTRDGKRLGPSDFVAGYTAVFAYDGFVNQNPEIDGFLLDGERITPECVNEECIALQEAEFSGDPRAGGDGCEPASGQPDGGRDAGTLDAGDADDAALEGGPVRCPEVQENPCSIPGAAGCLPVCPQKGDCEEHDIKVVIPESSAEIDEVARARRGEEIFEQMWINYYLDGGSVGSDVRLLSDATLGFNESHGTTLKAPKEPGPFRVWAVAHDNRGGASWVRVVLGAR